MSRKVREHKGPQLILPGGQADEAEDDVSEFDQEMAEMISQQALQLVATNIAFAALAGEVAKLSAEPSGFVERLHESSLAILRAMPMPTDDAELTKMFHDTVTENINVTFELLIRAKHG
jgi:hypothetical protein